MGRLLKIKLVCSRVNVHILSSTSVPHDGASDKFSTDPHETDNSVMFATLDKQADLYVTIKQYFSFFIEMFYSLKRISLRCVVFGFPELAQILTKFST
jgi:hypothetical protein